eukprot:scaffold64510_cov59-Phaeocystis_antarctica.AAC.5
MPGQESLTGQVASTCSNRNRHMSEIETWHRGRRVRRAREPQTRTSGSEVTRLPSLASTWEGGSRGLIFAGARVARSRSLPSVHSPCTPELVLSRA